MKILITGISGLLGSELAGKLAKDHEVIGLSLKTPFAGFPSHTIDITDSAATYTLVTRINPDLIIHTAAMSNVDECEKDPDSAYRINSLGTRNLAACCQRFDAGLLYISTDYAFTGKSASPKEGFSEHDPINPANEYARSKTEGEWFVRHLVNRFFIVRTSWLFGSRRATFVNQIASAFAEKRPVKVASDMKSAPTYVKDLAVALSELITTHRYGVYHLSNSGFASRLEIAEAIAELMHAPRSLIKEVKQEDLNLSARRPHFSGLKNHRWALEGFTPLRPWQKALKEFLGEQNFVKESDHA